MSNGNGVAAGAAILGGGALVGLIMLAASQNAQATQAQLLAQQAAQPTAPPTGETEVQTYTPADGTKEVKILFPEGTRYVLTAEFEFTPTLIDGGPPAVGDTGLLYIIMQEHGKLPEIHKFPDGSTHRHVEVGVHYEFDIPINKYLDFFLFRVRRAGLTTEMNDIVVVLSKR